MTFYEFQQQQAAKGIAVAGGNEKDDMEALATANEVSGANQESAPPSSQLNTDDETFNSKLPDTNNNLYKYLEMQEIEPFAPENFTPPKRYGVPSLFNAYALFVHPACDKENKVDNYYDKDGTQAFPKKDREVTLDRLLKDFDPNEEKGKGYIQPYYAMDFLYTKYYNKIPLNHLITLRRYPYPTYDNLTFGQSDTDKFRPLAQAVTYFGEPTGNQLAQLLNFKGSIKWKELEAEINTVDGNEQGFDSSPGASALGGKTKSALKIINFASGASGDLSQRRQAEIDASRKYGDVDYTNKVLGPVNVITKTHIRDRGIGDLKEYSIVFEYQLQSINGVNPKMAMLDLLSNMLALCFNNAKFWGGANRYFPNSPQFSFFGDQKAFYEGRYGDYGQSVFDTLKGGLGNISNALGDIISGIMSGDLSSLKKLAGKAVGLALDGQSAKTRPALLGFKSLLSGLPVGEWHMVVGNPLNPIASVGNLICTGFEFEFSNFLGADDFPHELKFTINLKDGRPRDKGDIESMFSMGQGRMYYPPKGILDAANSSTSTSSAAPSNTKGGKLKVPEVPDRVKRGFGSVF